MTLHLAHLAIAAVVLYLLYSHLRLSLARARVKKAHGCQPVTQYKQVENVLGLQYFLERIKVAKENRILEEGLKRYEQYGNTYAVNVMGSTTYLTIEPENVKAVLSTNFQDYGLGSRLKILGPLLGRGIFTTDGAQWEHSRQLVRPTFKKTQLADLDVFETHVQHLIDAIPRNQTVDLQPLFFRLTVDSVTEFLLGESVRSLGVRDVPESQDFGFQFDRAQDGLITRFRLGPLLWLYRDPKFFEACRFCREYVERFVSRAIRRHREGKPKESKVAYVFLDELVHETEDPDALRDELMNVLLAGRDTTASLLSNLFVMLAKHPHVWRRLREEVQTLGGQRPNYETLRGLTYLRYVVNESLRLHPVVPGNGREALRDTILPVGGGPDGKSPVFVAKGSRVAYTVYAMHRRKDIFGDDADEFNPDRWETVRPGWAYLPFNGGPRVCPGQQYALTVVSYTVVRILQTFEQIEDREPRPWHGKPHLTMCSMHGTKVCLR